MRRPLLLLLLSSAIVFAQRKPFDVNALLPLNFLGGPTYNPFNFAGPPLLTIRVSPVSSQDFIWAFVTLTHDETQHFTAIGPQ